MISEGTDVPISPSTQWNAQKWLYTIVMLVNNSFTWLPYEQHHAVYICEKDTDQLHSYPKGNDAHFLT